jgi:hypothetical protein
VCPLDLEAVHERKDVEIHVWRAPLPLAVGTDGLAVAAHVDGQHPIGPGEAGPEAVHHPVERRAAGSVDEDDGRPGPPLEVVKLRAVRMRPELLLPSAGDDRDVGQFRCLRRGDAGQGEHGQTQSQGSRKLLHDSPPGGTNRPLKSATGYHPAARRFLPGACSPRRSPARPPAESAAGCDNVSRSLRQNAALSKRQFLERSTAMIVVCR